ncbi:MAG: hypothetical protein LBS11_12920 [Oscillospiraceae bacterium]|jgi:hypothetical protein|nr:hypothetical protein [Oscillospiraceae bacterium]
MDNAGPTPFELITSARKRRKGDAFGQDRWASVQAGVNQRMTDAPAPEPAPEPQAQYQPPYPNQPNQQTYQPRQQPYQQNFQQNYQQPYQQPQPYGQGLPLYPQPPSQQPSQQPQPSQPQRVGWNLRDPRGEHTADPYPRPQPARPTGPSRHRNLDAIHKRHEDALKSAVFQTARKIIVKGSPDDPT